MALTEYSDKFTVSSLVNERYSDFYINLNINFGSGDIARQTNEAAIISSLKNIIFTRKGERMFFPDFGCDVLGLLFENFSKFSSTSLETEIKTAVENFEPRIKTIKAVVTEHQDDHTFNITLFFTTINSPETVSVSFLLSRIR
jgi:phage baseplate assembly protein W